MKDNNEEERARCPRELRWAVMQYALAVKMASDLGGSDDPRCLYHRREYLYGMERTLVAQVVTAFPRMEEAEAVLRSAGLGHLVADAEALAAEPGG